MPVLIRRNCGFVCVPHNLRMGADPDTTPLEGVCDGAVDAMSRVS